LDAPPQRPLLSVIVPTRNRTEKLSRCLDSVYGSDYPRIEVVVVDDASTEPVEWALAGKFPEAKFIRNPTRRLLSCSRNAGAAASHGEYLFFLDDDNVLDAEAIEGLLRCFEAGEKVAVSAPVIYYLAEPHKVWTSYIVKSRLPGFYILHTDVPDGVAGTFSFHNSFVVRRSVFEEVRGFDCANLPIRFSEVDFAHKIRTRGYTAVVNPAAKVWHDLGWSLVHIDSARAYYTERNRIIVLKRYYDKRDFTFYSVCLLPFLGAYYLVHHPLSTSDGRLKTASSFVRGTVDGLRFKEPSHGFRGSEGSADSSPQA
jgi:GT2 family glycosyltransferase